MEQLEHNASADSGLAASVDADHGRAYYRGAEALIEAKDANGALTMLQQAIEIGAINSGAILRTVTLATRLGAETMAVDTLAAAVMRKPSDVGLLEGLGQRLVRLDRAEEAAQLFTTAANLYVREQGDYIGITQQSRLAELLGQVGAALATCRQNEAAADVLEEARKFDPGSKILAHNLSSVLITLGRFAEAETVCRTAIATGGSSADLLLNLANACTRLGKLKEAEIAYDHASLLSPGDRVLAHLAGAVRGDQSRAAPLEYVRDLYNSYAANFDEHALQGLLYRVPGLILKLIDGVYPGRIGNVLDLGCGSGLIGAMIYERADSLVGVDISPNMLDESRKKGIYSELCEAGMEPFLRADARKFELIIAADSLIYTGDLSPLFSQVAGHLTDQGRFIFTVEAGGQGSGWALKPNGRYAHDRAYLEATLSAAGMVAETVQTEALRRDADGPVDGLLFVARKAA